MRERRGRRQRERRGRVRWERDRARAAEEVKNEETQPDARRGEAGRGRCSALRVGERKKKGRRVPAALLVCSWCLDFQDIVIALPVASAIDVFTSLQFVPSPRTICASIQASTLSRRWAHLPLLLSRLLIDVADFLPRDKIRRKFWTVDQVMTDHTLAVTRTLLPSSSPSQKNDRTIKHLRLSFYLTDPYLHTVGHAVENVVKSAKTDCLEFTI
ncbi:hypothetical protein PR202_gb25226 [Eleusine coracana subsp. coracana]|uniref:Uncharacterized protein n=1 Tax=Eleusine coracana subsp. coracana TaxID=191504 RepID=A0AAV5FL11_ELECO|nr:hypothetical protein PR202_gb25226 [Eleusine coracana subsp. coracana]